MATLIADVVVTSEALHEIADELEEIGYAHLIDTDGREVRLISPYTDMTSVA